MVADTYVLKCCLHQGPKRIRNRHPRGFPGHCSKQIFDLCKNERLFWVIEGSQISHQNGYAVDKPDIGARTGGLEQIRTPTIWDSLSSSVRNKWREETPDGKVTPEEAKLLVTWAAERHPADQNSRALDG